MKIDEIRKLLHAARFQPFKIHVADGRTLQVPHPDFVALTGNNRTLIVTSTGKPSFTLVDIPLITQLEVEGSPETV
jgi:hypothetical protein